MTRRATVGIALAAAFAWAAPAGADRLNPKSRAEIAKLLELVAPTGERIAEIHFGDLATGGLETVSFIGDRSVEYYFNLICDDDCQNVDLAALDAAGLEIDVDDADDSAPVLNVQADEYKSVLDAPTRIPRPMTIEIRMTSCKKALCAYGLMITQTE